jgi:hypothetical protein
MGKFVNVRFTSTRKEARQWIEESGWKRPDSELAFVSSSNFLNRDVDNLGASCWISTNKSSCSSFGLPSWDIACFLMFWSTKVHVSLCLVTLVFTSLELICTSSSLELVLNSIRSCIALLDVSVSRKPDRPVYQTGASDFGCWVLK